MSDPVSHSLPAAPRWGELFLERFDLNVRACGAVVHPADGTVLKVNPKMLGQTFRRDFGEVVLFSLSAGLIARSRLHLAAIRLNDGVPEPELLRRVGGPDGLDFVGDHFYSVGLFAPGGWPEEWKAQAALRGNALFYLVEKGDGTGWGVFGPENPLLRLFDPETTIEKAARAAQALAGHPRLVMPGDQVEAGAFAAELRLDAEALEKALAASQGRFHKMEYKGKTYIQRSIR